MSRLTAEAALKNMDMSQISLTGFLVKAAEAEKSPQEVLELLANASDEACDTFAENASVVRESVIGVEELTPGAGNYEMLISDKLSELAERLKKS